MDQVKRRSYKYDAFISYRHLPFDKVIAKKLHTLLETYRLPRILTLHGFPERLDRVFRDEEELPTAAVLTDSIDRALEESNWLLVVCTPNTMFSAYIRREIQTFISLGRADRILTLLVKGESEESVPESLREIPGFETRLVDLRSPKKKQTFRQLSKAISRIIAACLECSEDELDRENTRRIHRSFLVKSAVASVILIIAGLYCYSQWRIADLARQRAKVERDGMINVIESLTYTLPDKMANISYTYPLVAEVLEQNLKSLDRIIELNGNITEALRDKAINYVQLERAWSFLGTQSKIRNLLGIKGLTMLEALADKEPNIKSWLFLAESYNSLGDVCANKSAYDDAIKYYQKVGGLVLKMNQDRTIMGTYSEVLSMCMKAQEALIDSYCGLGNAYSNKGLYDKAIQDYRKALSIREKYSEFLTSKVKLAQIYNGLGNVYLMSGAHDEAIKFSQNAIVILKDLAWDKTNKNVQMTLLQSYGNLGNIYMGEGVYADAIKNNQNAIVILKDLARDKTNKNVQMALAKSYYSLGYDYGMKGAYDDAIRNHREAIAIQEALAKDKADKNAQEALAQGYYNLGNDYGIKGAYGDAIRNSQKALVILEQLKKDNNTKNILSNLYGEITWYKLLTGDRDYPEIKRLALKGLECAPNRTWIKVNLAHDYLFNNEYNEAVKIYLSVKDIPKADGKHTYKDDIIDDFTKLKARGVTCPDMEKVEQLLKQ